jgi:Asp-tRNA(Asn)/Glu-tRNA(Gln) amidotransferase A subunit family amidase
LSAGLVPLATATDVGGSIRIPAALCGLVGLKPTAGLIGRDVGLASLDLNNHGPLTATVADARLLMEILRGPAPGDFGSLPRWSPDRRASPARLIVAARFVAGPPLPGPLAAAFGAAVERLANAIGARVEVLESSQVFPGGFEAQDWFRIVGVEQAHALGREAIEDKADLFDPVFIGYMRAAMAVTAEDYARARLRRARYAREFDVLLGDDAVLATPTLTVDGWSAEGRLSGSDTPGLPGWVFNTEPPNLTGHPAISLPAGRLPNGLPFGLQIVGPRFGDWLLLDLAEVWEAVAPWPLAAAGYMPFSVSALEATPPKEPKPTSGREADPAG